MADKVNLTEFAKGFVQPSSYWKSLGIGLKLGMILVIGYSLYYLLFAKKPTQSQTINIKKGASATIIQKQEAHRSLIPFIEGGIEKNNKTDTSFETYLRTGVKWEF